MDPATATGGQVAGQMDGQPVSDLGKWCHRTAYTYIDDHVMEACRNAGSAHFGAAVSTVEALLNAAVARGSVDAAAYLGPTAAPVIMPGEKAEVHLVGPVAGARWVTGNVESIGWVLHKAGGSRWSYVVKMNDPELGTHTVRAHDAIRRF